MYARVFLAVLPFLAGVSALDNMVKIKPKSSAYQTLCLAVPTGKIQAGERVDLSKCAQSSDENSKFQEWRGPTGGNHGSQTISIFDLNMNEFCLDRGDHGVADGTILTLEECASGNASVPVSQLWSYDEGNNHIFNYLYPETDEQKKDEKGCVSLREDTQVEGGEPPSIEKYIQFSACSNDDNTQIWDIVNATSSA